MATTPRHKHLTVSIVNPTYVPSKSLPYEEKDAINVAHTTTRSAVVKCLAAINVPILKPNVNMNCKTMYTVKQTWVLTLCNFFLFGSPWGNVHSTDGLGCIVLNKFYF